MERSNSEDAVTSIGKDPRTHPDCRYSRRRARPPATEGRKRAQALRDECIEWLPRAAASLLPAMDRVTRLWLQRSFSPYTAEIYAIASAPGFSGIWFLNGCYQWGCTALAREQGYMPWLVRTLDWPFPGLGRHAEVA